MSIPRARKRKSERTHRPTKSAFEIVKLADYLNLAIMVRTLHQVYGWKKEQLEEFIESYIALMEEVGRRNTVEGQIRDTKELTGIDVRLMLDEVFERGAQKMIQDSGDRRKFETGL